MLISDWTIWTHVVLGHLPKKELDFKRKFRPLAATYVTFSPDGRELLANLGGEQIYLFDVTNPTPSLIESFEFKSFLNSADHLLGEKSEGEDECLRPEGSCEKNRVETLFVWKRGSFLGYFLIFMWCSAGLFKGYVSSPPPSTSSFPALKRNSELPANIEAIKLEVNLNCSF